MTQAKYIHEDLIAGLLAQSAASPRRRTHHNLHPSLDDLYHRLLFAAAPGTYVRPHRHVEPEKWELFVVLRGAAVALLFDLDGRVIERLELVPERCPVVEIPPAVWHSLAVVAPDTLLLEVKPGPYVKTPEKHFASWAPAEGDLGAGAFEQWMRLAQVGDRPPTAPNTSPP